ncbi:MAG: 3-dehydroquinate synthase family protein [Acidimicrobiales bacterium]
MDLPVVIIGWSPEVTEAVAADVADRVGRPVTAVGPEAADTVDQRAELAREAITVWLDHGARSVGHRRWLGVVTTVADVIVTAPGLDDQQGPPDRAAQAAAVDEIVAAVTTDRPRPEVRVETVAVDERRRYPVVIGRGARHRLADVLPAQARRVAVVTQPPVGVTVDIPVEHRVFELPDGEMAKSLDVLGRVASELAQWGLTRRDVIVSVGGGAVSDLSGYLAASYHRGVEVIHVSTTLLGQIDAAIGGKCGVNLPEGKNLLGAFKQPAAVLCDTSTLGSLPAAEFLSGMGELAKYHFLGGGRLDRLPLDERVAACVRIKGDVVAGDETEQGRRVILNYGHTLAHALETLTGYGIRHGEAVAVGLVYAAELAFRLGRIDAARVAEHRRVVATYGLSAHLPPDLDADAVVDAFAADKKAVDGITFVLDGPDGVAPVVIDDRSVLLETLATVR